jgi:hypothetical protein
MILQFVSKKFKKRHLLTVDLWKTTMPKINVKTAYSLRPVLPPFFPCPI